MRPCVETPFIVRGRQFGGNAPLFCVPLVAGDVPLLLAQAQAVRAMAPDLVEWRADSHDELTARGLVTAAKSLRAVMQEEPLIFTLRIKGEGGAREMSQDVRRLCLEAVVASGLVDMVDLELCNGPLFLDSLVGMAHAHGVRTILSFHDFQATPANERLLGTIAAMSLQGADVAKIAVMPQQPADVLRLFQVTLEARRRFPGLPLSATSMGRLGSVSRVAGFLYGSDMAFAVGQQASAPGQIPIAEARAMAAALLRYA